MQIVSSCSILNHSTTNLNNNNFVYNFDSLYKNITVYIKYCNKYIITNDEYQITKVK